MYRFDSENHIHLFDEKPLIGSTTALKILAKPLTWWAVGIGLGKLGWTNSKLRVNGRYQSVPLEKRLEALEETYRKIVKMSPEEFLKLLDQSYRAHDDFKNERAVTGSDIHKELEVWIKECIKSNEGVPQGTTPGPEWFKEFVKNNVKRFLWSEAHVYSLRMWTGGIADAGWEDYQDRVIAGDFKSSKEGYFDQYLQVGGYDTMLTEHGGHTPDGVKIFELPKPIVGHCVIPFGIKEGEEPQIKYNVESNREGYEEVVNLYKRKQFFEQ